MNLIHMVFINIEIFKILSIKADLPKKWIQPDYYRGLRKTISKFSQTIRSIDNGLTTCHNRMEINLVTLFKQRRQNIILLKVCPKSDKR